MILSPCINQINRYSFLVKDVTTQQMYDDAGVDLTTVTAAKLIFKNLNDNSEYEIDILSDWEYLLGDGLTINIIDFPDEEMSGYDHFPDWMYEITVSYVYDEATYAPSKDSGFRYYISNIVYQQTQQEDWKLTLKCGCDCGKYSTTLRKFNFLNGLGIAAKNCLINQYTSILLALYKLTGTTHEYE